MTTPPIDELFEDPEQRSANQRSLSGLSELTPLELQEQDAQRKDVVPLAPPVIVWRRLMLEQ